MGDNPEFDKALKNILGDAVEYLNCPDCKCEMKICNKCGEAICPNFCEEETIVNSP